MTTLQLQVEEVHQEDSGRGITRLDMDALFRLRISPGDCIEIEGNNATTATAWQADETDKDTGIIRLDKFIRQNADVAIGETVEIRKAKVTEATSLTLRAPEDDSDRFDADAREEVKRQLLKRPVRENDIVPVRATETHLAVRSPGQVFPLIVTSTDRKKPAIVTDGTTIIIQ